MPAMGECAHRLLSVSLHDSATASPFPSPSSSFLTPPTPGAHEFALKPVPSVRSLRKSATSSPRSSVVMDSSSQRDDPASPSTSSDSAPHTPTLPISPVTPTPGALPSHIPVSSSPEPPAPIQAPLLLNIAYGNSLEVPPSTPILPRPRTNLINRGSRPLSTASTTSTASHSSASAFDPTLFSSRPAPPSPGGGSTPSLSRKPSSRSKPGSSPVSRANSLRHHRGSSHASLVISSSPGSTLSGRGEGAANPHHIHRVSAGSQLHTRTFSSSSLALPTDMGISASSPAIQDISTPITTLSLSPEGSSRPPSTISSSVSTTDTQFQSLPPDEHKVFIKIRDFAFQPADERHNGQGPFVPKPNRVGRMNRRLGGRSSSISSSDGDGVEEDDESDGWGWNSGARGFGYGGGWVGGRFSWAVSSTAAGGTGAGAATAASIFDQEKAYAAAAANLSAAASKTNGNANIEDGYPSRSEMDRNFLDSESEEFYDAEDSAYDELEGERVSGVEDDDDEPLYPGLYRALYAFEPEGTAEMRLVEDQIVRVAGRGGGVGWAVVVAEGTTEVIMDSIGDDVSKTTKHALVPESYLEPYRLDWEHDEGDANINRRTA